MKGIYQGSVVEVEFNGRLAKIVDDGIRKIVPAAEVLGVPKEEFSLIETEYNLVKREISSIISEMNKLIAKSSEKRNELQELFMTARGKEISIIGRLVKDKRRDIQFE